MVPKTPITELTIEEHPLKFEPTTDPLTFVPEQGSQAELLAKHQQERELPVPDNSMLFEGQPAFSVQTGDEDLVAVETYNKTVENQTASQKVTVQVLKGEKLILSIEAGDISPINNLRGLWAYSDHWVVEVAHVTLAPDSNETPLEPNGEIFIDGKSLNETYGYDQSFGFQLIHGIPFYFFQQNGNIGISYNGEQIQLEYDQIPHYQCCSASALNPKSAPNMVSFFAQRQGTWYYVEIGVFE